MIFLQFLQDIEFLSQFNLIFQIEYNALVQSFRLHIATNDFATYITYTIPSSTNNNNNNNMKPHKPLSYQTTTFDFEHSYFFTINVIEWINQLKKLYAFYMNQENQIKTEPSTEPNIILELSSNRTYLSCIIETNNIENHTNHTNNANHHNHYRWCVQISITESDRGNVLAAKTMQDSYGIISGNQKDLNKYFNMFIEQDLDYTMISIPKKESILIQGVKNKQINLLCQHNQVPVDTVGSFISIDLKKIKLFLQYPGFHSIQKNKQIDKQLDEQIDEQIDKQIDKQHNNTTTQYCDWEMHIQNENPCELYIGFFILVFIAPITPDIEDQSRQDSTPTPTPISTSTSTSISPLPPSLQIISSDEKILKQFVKQKIQKLIKSNNTEENQSPILKNKKSKTTS